LQVAGPADCDVAALSTCNLQPATRNCAMNPLNAYLLLSAFLFAIGLAGALTRRNAIIVLIGIELMLNAANLNFIAFWRFSEHPEAITGIMFVIFSIGVAAAEAAVGLALIIAIYRHYKTTSVDEMNSLKG
jgi:NADH:ubiquinone oxidoreductase subunit K